MSDQKGKKMKVGYAFKEPSFKGNTKAIENYVFYYGRRMDNKCDYSSIKFLNWVGQIHGESAAASIEKNQLTLVKVSLPPDMTQTEYDEQTMLEKK